MNCSTVRRRLLALDSPDQPPALVQEHIDYCSICQEVQRRLLQVERHVARVAVPPAQGRAAFVARFRQQSTLPERLNVRLRELQRWQLTLGALAASLLLFFLVWHLAPDERPALVRPNRHAAPDQLLAALTQRQLKLAVAAAPREQVETLAALAEDLRGQSAALHYYGSGKEGQETLKDLSDWYGRVVRMGVARAVQLPAEHRRAVLDPIARQLGSAGDDSERVARDARVTSADHPLMTMAQAARDGKGRLEELLLRDDLAARPGPTAPQSFRRFTLLAVICLTTHGVARAEFGGVPAVLAADQAQRFQRNRRLIQALVENSLRLAELNDVVHRASSCTDLADQLGEELQAAVSAQDAVRAAELAKALKELLIHGVAFNLTTANAIIPVGAVREPEMLQIGAQVRRIAAAVADRLQTAAPRDDAAAWEKVAKAVSDGQAEVAKALKGRGAPLEQAR